VIPYLKYIYFICTKHVIYKIKLECYLVLDNWSNVTTLPGFIVILRSQGSLIVLVFVHFTQCIFRLYLFEGSETELCLHWVWCHFIFFPVKVHAGQVSAFWNNNNFTTWSKTFGFKKFYSGAASLIVVKTYWSWSHNNIIIWVIYSLLCKVRAVQ